VTGAGVVTGDSPVKAERRKSREAAKNAARDVRGCRQTSKWATGALKGRGFSRAAHRFRDLRHGWKAVPFQNSDAQIFPQPRKPWMEVENKGHSV
jgi:hypothetical protein